MGSGRLGLPGQVETMREATKTRGKKRTSRASGAVTLEDVSARAGGSAITVSRGLQRPEKVAPATRERVKKAIAETGYVPNLLAGGLASRRSRLIAAFVPSLGNSVYSETVKEFGERLKEAGYQILLGEFGFDRDAERSLLEAVMSRRPDGILLTGIHHSVDCRRLLKATGIPIVETWDLTDRPLDIVVGFSHQRIGEAVADFLYRKNCRQVGLLTGRDDRAKTRQAAMTSRLKKLGMEKIEVVEVDVPTSFRLGREGMAELISRGFKEGIVACSSDTLAQGALAELNARSIQVPGTIGLMGLGDQDYAAHMHPALTTIRFDRVAMGRHAAESLLKRIDGLPVENPVMDIGFEIVERDSC
ncbi:MAG: LacI family DNA-binding transcriptional regulator [Puniceicoccaceae bacterium]